MMNEAKLTMRILSILFAFLILWHDIDSFAAPRLVWSRLTCLPFQQQQDSNKDTRPLMKKRRWRHKLAGIALGTMLWWKGPTEGASRSYAKSVDSRPSVRTTFKTKPKQTSSRQEEASWKTNNKKTIKIGSGVVVLTAVAGTMLARGQDNVKNDESSQIANQSWGNYDYDSEIPLPPAGILAATEVEFDVPLAWKEAMARNSGAPTEPSNALFDDGSPEIDSDKPNLSNSEAPTTTPTSSTILQDDIPEIGSGKPNLSQIISSDGSDKDVPQSWREEVDSKSKGFDFSEPPASNDADVPLLWREQLAEKESSSSFSTPLPWEVGDPQDPDKSNPYEGGGSWT